MTKQVRVNRLLRRITNTFDPREHRMLIKSVCDECDAWEIYEHVREGGGTAKVKDILKGLEYLFHLSKDFMTEEEYEGAIMFSQSALAAHDNKDFEEMAKIIFDLVFCHALNVSEKMFGLGWDGMTLQEFCSELESPLSTPLYVLGYLAQPNRWDGKRGMSFAERELLLMMSCFMAFYQNLEMYEV